MFTEEELVYIKQLIISSKESLDDCCPNRISEVYYISQEDADAEYKLIDSILDKLKDYDE